MFFEMLYELVVGAAFGLALGYAARLLLVHYSPSTPALFPVLTLGFALMAFGVADVFNGSGFLAVYIAGIVVGNSKLARSQRSRSRSRFTLVALAGLDVPAARPVGEPERITGRRRTRHVDRLAVAFIARPVVVTLCLLPFQYNSRERTFISWVGLRGAVPIIMATVPILRAEGKSAQMA